MADTEIVVLAQPGAVVAVPVQPASVAVVTTVAPTSAVVPVRDRTPIAVVTTPGTAIKVNQPRAGAAIVVRPVGGLSLADIVALIGDPDSALYAALVAFLEANGGAPGGGGITFVDNGDGTWTAEALDDNGDGTWTADITDNGDGTWSA